MDSCLRGNDDLVAATSPGTGPEGSRETSENAVGEVLLLSGGNPQIAKGDGDAPVQAYIAAMPGWKSDLGRRLDDLIERVAPDVRKAVRWNSPWYGVEGEGWFASFHVFTRYVKVTFLSGAVAESPPTGLGQGPGLALGGHSRRGVGRGAYGGVGAAGGRAARLERILRFVKGA